MFEHLDDPTPPYGGAELLAASAARGAHITRRRRALIAGTSALSLVAVGAGVVVLSGWTSTSRDTLQPAATTSVTQTEIVEPTQPPTPTPTPEPTVAPTLIAVPDPVPTESPTISPTPTSYDFGPQVPTQLCGPTGPTGGAPVPGLTLAMQLTSSPEGEFGFGWNVRLVVRNTTDHDVAFYPAGADRIDLGQVLSPDGGTVQGGNVNSDWPSAPAFQVVLPAGQAWTHTGGISASNGVGEDVYGRPTPTGCDLRNGPHLIRTALPLGVGKHQVLWWGPTVAVTVIEAPTPSPSPSADPSPTAEPSTSP